ncbi:MAG TPA: DNA-processing protein DprA [Candidatus Paceibacterota bacterium]|nr:DNA-processing protein DprA [Candidatus Paceibacterota bacterium]
MHSVNLNTYFPLRVKVPELLYIIGALPPPEYKRIVIVGTRKPSSYGIACTKSIIDGLEGYPITIISGMALGIDALVHQRALHAHLHTIAFPGSGINKAVRYPKTNVHLSEQIIDAGGALLSPWESQTAAPWTFPVRNRIMAGIADLVIIIESTIDSGTMITARAAQTLHVPLGAIPGNIDNPLSSGPNLLLQEGAHCITNASVVLKLIGIDQTKNIPQHEDTNATIHPLFAHITQPMHKDELMQLSGLSASSLNSEITLLELNGMIKIDAQGMVRKNC